MKHPVTSRRRHTLLCASLLVAVAVSGCSKALPTNPLTTDSGVTRTAQMATTTSTLNWSLLASQWVAKGAAATVSGGRYQIQLVRGSLGQGAQVTIMQRDPAITDVLVGPTGTTLAKAATLTISYAGSNADQSSDFGISPKLYRLNESTGVWELVAGTNDPAAKKYSAKVSVLCRYALSLTDPGKGGW